VFIAANIASNAMSYCLQLANDKRRGRIRGTC
jgi:uncharacterized membrane protein